MSQLKSCRNETEEVYEGGKPMKSFLKICVLVCFSLNGLTVYAQYAEKCENAKDAELAKCRLGIEEVKAYSTADAVKSAAVVGSDESTSVTAKEGLNNSLSHAGRISSALDACRGNAQKFMNKCQEQAEEAQKKLKTAKEEEKPRYQAEIENIHKVEENGKKEFIAVANELKGSNAEAVAKAAQFQDSLNKMTGSGGSASDDFTWKDAGKWGAIAGLAGVGAMALFGGGGDSGGGKGTSQSSGTGSAGGVGVGTSEPTPTPVDCTNLAVAVGSSTCDATTVTTCTPSNKITTADCQTFSGRYCGLGGTGTGAGTGAGTGTSYCRAALAYSFCATTGRSQCASCMQVAQWSSPACANNPGEDCKAQFTKAQLITLRDTVPACGSDPINAELDLWVDPNPLLPGPVLPSSVATSSVGDGRQVAAQSVVKPAYGTGLLKSNSDALTKMCKKNELVDCDL